MNFHSINITNVTIVTLTDYFINNNISYMDRVHILTFWGVIFTVNGLLNLTVNRVLLRCVEYFFGYGVFNISAFVDDVTQ